MDKFLKIINETKSQKLPYVLIVGDKEGKKIDVISQGLTPEGVSLFLSTAHMLADPTSKAKGKA